MRNWLPCWLLAYHLTALPVAADDPCTLAIVNARVITVDPAQPSAEAIAVRGDIIQAVGTNAQIRALIGESTRVLDARGRTVVPGFNDAHLHPRPIYPVLSRLGGHPTCDILGLASTEHPIHLGHSSGHGAAVISMALRLAEIDATIIGGQVVYERTAAWQAPSVQLPEQAPVKLEVHATLGAGPAKENSGIVKSRTQPDVFWMHNDSGDEPRIYPVRLDGTVHASSRAPEQSGVLIGDAINVDWEDIAVNDQNEVIVADFGNNRNDRRDLVLYYVDEPSALAARTTVKRKVFFCYPDQPQIPAPEDDFNYDSEAIYTLGNRVYILTKHRSDHETRLYRLDRDEPFVTNPLTLVDRFDIHGQVVGADASPDGKRVVVITYDAIWLFDLEPDDDNLFRGAIRWLPYEAAQVEAVCFADDNTLLLADEETAELFKVPIADLISVRGALSTRKLQSASDAEEPPVEAD